MLDLNYDPKNDVLYLGFTDKSNSYGDEIEDGFIVMKDILTDKITGFTIFDFKKRYDNNTLTQITMPIPIDFKQDVLNRIQI